MDIGAVTVRSFRTILEALEAAIKRAESSWDNKRFSFDSASRVCRESRALFGAYLDAKSRLAAGEPEPSPSESKGAAGSEADELPCSEDEIEELVERAAKIVRQYADRLGEYAESVRLRFELTHDLRTKDFAYVNKKIERLARDGKLPLE